VQNANLDELEDLLDPNLPAEFTLHVPDAWLRGTLMNGALVVSGTKERIPETTTSIRITVLGHEILLEADSHPDGWTTH
jgi:hypothetical protein